MMSNAHAGAPASGAGDLSPTGNPSNGPANPKMRKRTKTGCLTCRKRRIKCGEERPTCGNCIKSKRQCEGYNQRVVFKTPIENWPNHPGHVSTIQYHTSMLPGSRNTSFRPPQPAPLQVPDSAHTTIQPRPSDAFNFANMDPTRGGSIPTSQQMLVGGTPTFAHDGSYQQPLVSPLHQSLVSSHHQQPLQSPLHQQPLPSPHHQQPLQSPHHGPMSNTGSYFPQPSPIHTSPPTQYGTVPSANYQSAHYPQPQQVYQQAPVSYDGTLESKPAISQAMPQQPLYQHQSSNSHDEQRSYHSHSSVSPRSDHYPSYPETRPAMPRYNSLPQVPTHQMPVSSAPMSQAGAYHYSTAISHADFSHTSYSSVQIPTHDFSSDVKYMPQPVLEQPVAISQAQESQLLLSGFGGDDHVSPTQILDEAAVENEDDDYWDVQSDEEMVDVDDGVEENMALASNEFDMIRRIHLETSNDLGIRRYDAFLYEGLLTNYRPEYAASPLRNAKTARVFAHFIHVTGPTLSAYERNPRNSTLIFEGPTPAAQQGLWTYILPLKALGHQSLLHAMLALASLHIARLQGASITPSYKHYAYALKRLGRSLANPRRRHSIPTLATSLLLAYYEVWTAEHTKWSTHLVGAALLLTELDFRNLTREARRLRIAEAAEDQQFPYHNPDMLINQRQLEQYLREKDMMPDEGLVSTIIGKKVNYDDFGTVSEEESGGTQGRNTNLPMPLDLRSFETLQDLYWWYARHDVLQSIVSGNPLIMPYRKWSDCPPRAPLGRSDALYGTNDHVILLLGRIADFTVRDRARKLKQVAADGGWRPRPEMPGFGSMGPSSSGGPGPGVQPPTPPTPLGPPSHMQGPPPGWTGGPPPGWKGPPPPGFGPPPGGLPTPTEGTRQSPPRGPPPGMPSFFGMAPAGPTAPLSHSYENPDYKRSPPTPNKKLPDHSNLSEAYQFAIEEWNEISAAHTTLAQILTNVDAFAPLPPDIAPPVPGSDGNMTPFGPALVHRSYDISILWTYIHLCKIILLRSHPAMPPAAQMAAGICAQATGPYATLIGRITAGMRIPVSEDLSPSLGVVLTESTMSLFFAGVQYQDPKQRAWLITRLLEIDRRTGWASAGIIARGCETAWTRAAQMGRGPPYERRTRSAGEEGSLVLETDDDDDDGPKTWRRREGDDYGKGLVVGTYKEEEMGQGGAVGGDGGSRPNEERGFVIKTRVTTWARNLLGTEEDLKEGMEKVELRDQ